MRKTFNLLFICLIALYGWIGYQVIHTTDLTQCQPEGSLSDVAEEVMASEVISVISFVRSVVDGLLMVISTTFSCVHANAEAANNKLKIFFINLLCV